jgi:hypothetical protein
MVLGLVVGVVIEAGIWAVASLALLAWALTGRG